jgi:Pro-kumamolisin, activation domain
MVIVIIYTNFCEGKWWTAEAITELVAPPKIVSDSIVTFLAEKGATKIENRRDMIKVSASVSFIGELLQTSLYSFQHKTRK